MSAPRFGWGFVAETPCAMRARKLRFVPSQNEKFCVNQQFCKWLLWLKFLHIVGGILFSAALPAFGISTARIHCNQRDANAGWSPAEPLELAPVSLDTT